MKPNNLSDYLEISAKTHSARTALSGDEVEFRYDELLEKGKALAVLIENQFGEGLKAALAWRAARFEDE